MTTVTLSLVSHTNVGKTTLARTLLGRDIGEVRDAPHVTEFADEHLLIESEDGQHRLMLWDTPGFGDSVRLARRMRQVANPLGWLLAEVWDRWRDRAFWMSQQALRHVKSGSDVLLYLVNASEPEAGYLQSEMQLLAWTGKPVLVLLNQLGLPRSAAEEEAELAQWRERLAPWARVRAVLPLDAFARCWVHEAVLLQAVGEALAGERPGSAVDTGIAGANALNEPPERTATTAPPATAAERLAAFAALRAAWSARHEARFNAACLELAESLARTATAREVVQEPAGFSERLRDWGARLVNPTATEDPAAAAQQRLATMLEAEVRASTERLLQIHGLAGRDSAAAAGGEQEDAVTRILERVAAQMQPHRRVPEGRSAVLGGALTGALAGLKADLATGGLTLGGGLLAGGLIGALGAAGLARGINLVRGTAGHSWVAWGATSWPMLAEAALLRYLAVAHYGRGRGEWSEAEAPPHWPAAVATALAPRQEAFERLWKGRNERQPAPDEAARLARALAPLVAASLETALAALYPQAPIAGLRAVSQVPPADNARV